MKPTIKSIKKSHKKILHSSFTDKCKYKKVKWLIMQKAPMQIILWLHFYYLSGIV